MTEDDSLGDERIAPEAPDRPPAGTSFEATRGPFLLSSLEPLERHALELANGGGMSVPSIAKLLEREPEDIRRALGDGLRKIAATASARG
ncbi:MAG: hypothetical protein AB7N24_06415 [Dehalococcoidia bacterium]